MAFVVKATLVAFMGDEERFPCHFLYNIGDSFIFDGEEFHGRICPGVLGPMTPVLAAMRAAGNKYCDGIPFRYTGLSLKDPSMKQYDGLGFRPIKEPPPGAQPQHLLGLPPKPPEERGTGWTFACGDTRTSALFRAEPIDICSRGFDTPYYRKSMKMLDKIKAEPGLTIPEILARFSDFERDEVYPPLTPLVAECLLDEMGQVKYLELRNGKYYPLERAFNTQTGS